LALRGTPLAPSPPGLVCGMVVCLGGAALQL